MATLAQTCASFVLQAPFSLSPLFQADLGLTKAEVGLLTSATSIGAWAVVLLGGILTDRFGPKWVMSVAMAVTGTLLLSMSMVGSLLQAMAVMFATGMARGSLFPSSTKAVLTWFPPRARATAMGLKQMGMPVAGIAAASVLPAIGLAMGWRMAMAIPGLLIVLGGLVALLLYRDAPGSESASAGKVSAKRALWELLRSRRLLSLCSIAFCFLIVQLSLLTYLVLYLAEVVLVDAIPDRAMRVVAAGGYLAVSQAGGAIARVSWGLVSDRLLHGRRYPVLAALGAAAAIALATLGNLGPQSPLWLLTLIVFGCGATAVGWNGVYNALVTESVGRKYAATGVGLSMTITEVGTIIGPPIFGLVVDHGHSFQTAWYLLACVSAMGAFAAFRLSWGEKREAAL